MARNEPTRNSTQLSLIFAEPNVWSDWHADQYIGPLSWVRLVALLSRDLTPDNVLNSLAPVLKKTRDQIEEDIAACAQQAPAEIKHVIRFQGYKDYFHDALPQHFHAFLDTLDGNADLEFLREIASSNLLWSQSLLWFFLNGIAHASVYGRIRLDKVDDVARWLAELEYLEPSLMPGDEYLLRHFFEGFCEKFERTEPLSETYAARDVLEDPSSMWEDDYVSRRRSHDDRWERQLMRTHCTPPHPVELPGDAWVRHLGRNEWDQALDLARVSSFGWRRQAAFMLRDVSLLDVAVKLEPALIAMADATDQRVLEWAEDHGIANSEIGFGAWFAQWREHFRHWHDPLRTIVNELCAADDASFLADWLPQFEPAVFADFLIQCAHARLYEDALSINRKVSCVSKSELFGIETCRPAKFMDLEDLSRKLWNRFRERHGVGSDPAEVWCSFGVDMNLPLERDQL